MNKIKVEKVIIIIYIKSIYEQKKSSTGDRKSLKETEIKKEKRTFSTLELDLLRKPA